MGLWKEKGSDTRIRTSPRFLEMWRRDLWRNMMMGKEEKDSLLGLVPLLDLWRTERERERSLKRI